MPRVASPSDVGESLYALVTELYPICRSITGEGVRRTLEIIARSIPLERTEVPTGTQAFDWVVPREWNIADAFIKNLRGERVVDFGASSLHVVSYSTSVHARLPLSELRAHLFTLPERPWAIPYRTSYYKEDWGFCLRHDQLESLTDAEYDVCIDSSLEDGHLTYAECVLPGESEDEVLISCHVCHPSLCNDNLSGIAVALFLAKALASRNRRYSYRFLFIPGTIGAIVWLSRNQREAARVKHGLVLTCVGDPGSFHYKKSRRGDAAIDRAMGYVLRSQPIPHEILEFTPYGYDERQFCSPGFNLPVGCFMRSVWGTFPQYHTSDDDLHFVTPDALEQSLQVCLDLVNILENDRVYKSTNPFCEPALGRRGLYGSSGGSGIGQLNLARLWVMNLADGTHSLLDISERSGLPFSLCCDVARELHEHRLLDDVAAADDSSK